MSARTYSLEARDKTGVLMGLTAVELALIGGGLFSSIFARLSGVPGFVAFVPLAVGWALAKAKVGSRPVREWIPLGAGWLAAGVTGRRQWSAPLPLLPATSGAALPPALAGVEIREIPTGPHGQPLAVVADKRGTRLSAVLAVGGAQFASADPASQDALLEGWGQVLASFAETASPVTQIGWSEVATPAGLGTHRAWAGQQLAVAGGAGDPASYLELVDDIDTAATAHQVVVWITVDGTEIRDGRGRPATRAAAHLPTAVDNLQGALFDAGLDTPGPLTAPELRQLVRDRIDPKDPAGGPNPSTGTLAERLGLVEDHNTGPLGVSTAWSQLRMDASFHRTWWVASWPRRPVPGDWLNGFLVAGTSRAMTVIHRPLDPARSQKRIESQLTKLAAHLERKDEKDRRVTEEELRTNEAVQTLEAELASGYSEVLYLGLLTVAAPTLDALEDAARHIEQAARTHGISLRVLHGRQDTGWAATLPFGLTEPGLLEVMGL